MIVDEIGGSMITLLPSCDTSGTCVVGEISVESDVGHGTIFQIEIPNGTKGKLKSKKLKLYGEE